MKKYRLLHGKLSTLRDGERVHVAPGDVVELTDYLVNGSLKGRVEPVSESEPSAQSEPSVSDMDWRKLVAAVEDSEDLDYVQSVLEQERQDRERPSVIKAAETRIEELSG